MAPANATLVGLNLIVQIALLYRATVFCLMARLLVLKTGLGQIVPPVGVQTTAQTLSRTGHTVNATTIGACVLANGLATPARIGFVQGFAADMVLARATVNATALLDSKAIGAR